MILCVETLHGIPKSTKLTVKTKSGLQRESNKDVLLYKGIDINDSLFKNKSKKWSTRLSNIASKMGIDFKSIEDECKKKVADKVKDASDEFLTTEGETLFKALADKIKKDLLEMKVGR